MWLEAKETMKSAINLRGIRKRVLQITWSDEEFIRQIKELIGNEGDIHVTCNHSEGEQKVTETHATRSRR